MKVQTAKRKMRLQEWAEQIADCNESGKTVRQWCEERGINRKTYYNRVKVVREEMLELIEASGGGAVSGMVRSAKKNTFALPEDRGANEGRPALQQEKSPVFASLPRPQAKNAAITVRIGEYVVDIQNSADDDKVEQVLRTMARL